jgi:hypothetical protein
MPQVFNLRGENVQTIAELRVDLIMSQDATIKIIEVDNTSKSVNLYNVEKIFTRSGREIEASKIKD